MKTENNKPIKTMYKAGYLSFVIKKVDIFKETDKFYLVSQYEGKPRNEKKDRHGVKFFDTHKEAKEYLIEYMTKKEKRLRLNLEKEINSLNKDKEDIINNAFYDFTENKYFF